MRGLITSMVMVPLCLALVACGQDPLVAQEISQKNATANGKVFIARELPAADHVVFMSDSTITKKCRGGDGWASGKAMTQGGKLVAPLKCSTTGNTKGYGGCFTEEDFLKKAAYANQEGVCDKSIKEIKEIKR